MDKRNVVAVGITGRAGGGGGGNYGKFVLLGSGWLCAVQIVLVSADIYVCTSADDGVGGRK